ncbi:conserved hypothetical protein [Rubrivivax sp. A210]|uniref:hypothetical protein n=1 Tax=Rubrivivax sp. A210 TaxID=2772301 RepID=UPI001918C784|nr:hypothetical protein [Rubrivivax sp. A210]CAD5374120.1 conserved hypothetical protein [Rubrivivax sp. A210]
MRIVGCFVLLLAGCASDQPARLGTAATTPLSDLNLVQAPIPEALARAQKGPYQVPDEPGCAVLAAQIAALDEVLGPDLDATATPANPGLIARGGEVAEGAAFGAIQRTAEGVIPFRGWVRKLTGAERYSKQVAAAIAAGTVRRAFLKGLGGAQACFQGAGP